MAWLDGWGATGTRFFLIVRVDKKKNSTGKAGSSDRNENLPPTPKKLNQ